MPASSGTQQPGERGFTERAQAQAGKSNADLYAGNHTVELSEQIQNDLGARVAFLHQLPDT